MTWRPNHLNQDLNIGGSHTQSQTKNKADEPMFYGQAVSGQTGSGASITGFSGNQLTLTGLSGMVAASVGRFLTISDSAANNGTFRIIQLVSASSVVVISDSGSAPDANNGSITWIEREPYTLEDDLNFVRTDRAEIKGVDFWEDVPVYRRPDDTLTEIPANLANIAGNTLDAHTGIEARLEESVSVLTSNTFITLNNVGNLKHADSTDILGVPITDGYDAGNTRAAFTIIVDAELDGYGDGAELRVLSGARAGERIFGLTRAGGSTSPNSVEVEFYSAPLNDLDFSSITPYTWEADQPNTINVIYPYRQRLDLLDENAWREALILGSLSHAGGSGGGSGSGLTESQHQTLRHLIHFIDSGPAEGFASGAFRECLPASNPFPTSETWYTSSAKTDKIVELTITRGVGQRPETESWEIYDTDGSTVLATVTDTITYSGPWEVSRERTIS